MVDDKNDLSQDEVWDEPESFSTPFGHPREMLERYTHCSQCGGRLHFTHLTDFSHNLTQELSKCPECGISGKKLIHRLH